MATVYKQFTAQDKALTPFNAHKQYDLTSGSAASNSITYYSTRWTSESYSTYSSGSASADINANVIKYNQIDKLYYRDYFTQLGHKLGPIKYNKQPRNLYEKMNILSIPMGLYGNEIKPSSFYLSASKSEIIDDKFGNLMISGTITSSYPDDIQQNIFRLDPIKGFKKYDLGVHDGYEVVNLLTNNPTGSNDYSMHYYRRGERITLNVPTTYTSNTKTPIDFYPKDFDDSYFINSIYYNNVTFNTSSLGSISHKFPKIKFSSDTSSFISSSHKETFNFNSDNDFSVSFWIRPKGITPQNTSGGVGSSAVENGFSIENYVPTSVVDSKKRYVIAKSRTKTIIPEWDLSGSAESQEVKAEPQFPYEIYMQSSSLYFNMSDGNEIKSIVAEIQGTWGNLLEPVHILCQNSGSIMEIWKNGVKQDSTTISFKDQTRNTANLYIASSGKGTIADHSGGVGSSSIGQGFTIGNYVNNPQNFHRHFNGDLNNINIWSRAYNNTAINNISESINASPYIGNIFYRNGFATITHPSYHDVLNKVGIGEQMIGNNTSYVTFEVGNNEQNGINTLQFQGTHLIYENEYQCTIREHEFNNTTNISARKHKSSTSHELADFATGSVFKPHVTTIGLYNENNDLVVIGKLNQPVRISDNTDTTFVVRWDH